MSSQVFSINSENAFARNWLENRQTQQHMWRRERVWVISSKHEQFYALSPNRNDASHLDVREMNWCSTLSHSPQWNEYEGKGIDHIFCQFLTIIHNTHKFFSEFRWNSRAIWITTQIGLPFVGVDKGRRHSQWSIENENDEFRELFFFLSAGKFTSACDACMPNDVIRNERRDEH